MVGFYDHASVLQASTKPLCGCDQLVVGQTQKRDGNLDLLLTGVPDLVPATV